MLTCLFRRQLFSRAMLLSAAVGLVLLAQPNAYMLPFLFKGSITNLGYYTDIYIFALDCSSFLTFTPLLAVLPGVLRFCEEVHSGYARMILTRCTKKRYTLSHTAVNALSGGCAVALPLILYAIFSLLCGIPYTEECLTSGHHTPVFNNPLLGSLETSLGGFTCILIIIACGFLFGMVWSTIGLAAAAITPNRYLALGIPLLLFFLLHLGFNAIGLFRYSPTNMILPDVVPSFGFLLTYQGILLLAALAVLFPAMKRRLAYV